MFRAPLCPSSGAHDDSVWLPHRSSGSRVAAGWELSAGRMDECPDRRMYNLRSGRDGHNGARNMLSLT